MNFTTSYTKQLYSGQVINFDKIKGFGYIKPDDFENLGSQLFFHFSDIYSAKSFLFKCADINSTAEFEIKTEANGSPVKAVNIAIKN